MRRSCSAAVTTWFRIPEQGMAKYEMLCRGTAFCTSLGETRDSLYIFTCAHVIAPWRWPRLYPVPWLQYVKPEHTLCLLHINEASGGPMPGRVVLDQHRAVHHEQLDVCIMPFMSEFPPSGRLRHTEMVLEPLQLRDSPPPVGEPVWCPAYVVERGRASLEAVEGGNDVQLDDDVVLDMSSDQEPRRLCVSKGVVTRFKDYQSRGFATMDQELTDGACGAPLVGDKGQCVGLVEGVVPRQRSPNDRQESVSDEDFNSIKGSAGFIYPNELLRLAEQARDELE